MIASAPWKVYSVSYRPVGWYLGASSSKNVLVVARDQTEAENVAVVLMGVADRPRLTQAELNELPHFCGRSHAVRAGYGKMIWLSTWEVDFDMRGTPLGVFAGLGGLIRARELARRLNWPYLSRTACPVSGRVDD